MCGIMELQNGQFDFSAQLGSRFERAAMAGASLYCFDDSMAACASLIEFKNKA